MQIFEINCIYHCTYLTKLHACTVYKVYEEFLPNGMQMEQNYLCVNALAHFSLHF